MCHAVIKALRNLKCLSRARYIFVPEKLGFGATTNYVKYMMEIPYVESVRMAARNQFGMGKDKFSTFEMVTFMQDCMRDDLICIWDKVITLCNYRSI